MRASAYLIIGHERRGNRVQRAWIKSVRQNRPALGANEAMVRLVLDVPDDAWDAPLIVVPVGKNEIAMAAAVEEMEEASDDEPT